MGERFVRESGEVFWNPWKKVKEISRHRFGILTHIGRPLQNATSVISTVSRLYINLTKRSGWESARRVLPESIISRRAMLLIGVT